MEMTWEKKREINQYYKDSIGNLSGISFQPESEDTFSNKWLTTILINKKESPIDKEKIILAFKKENIDARPLWKPMHMQPVFSDALSYTSGVSENLFDRGLCLPSGTNLAYSKLDRICSIIRKFYK